MFWRRYDIWQEVNVDASQATQSKMNETLRSYRHQTILHTLKLFDNLRGDIE